MAKGQEPFHSDKHFEVRESTPPGGVRLENGKYVLPKMNAAQLKEWADERRFMEDIVYKRFTFLLTILGAVIAGVIAIKDPLPSLVVCLVGLLSSVLILKSVHRAYAKTCFYNSVLIAERYPPLALAAQCFKTPPDQNVFVGEEALSMVGRRGPNLVVAVLSIGVLWALLSLCFTQFRIPYPSPAPGRDGRDGARGPQGAQGPKGSRGPAGRDGRDGRDSITGPFKQPA